MIRYDGVLLCHKPYMFSSHKVVSTLRQIIGQKKIGHTGTLDPRATGLMIICLGRATKIAQFLSDLDKTYIADIKLGMRSTTYDSEGIINEESPMPVPPLEAGEISKILDEFRGVIAQKVPPFSAVKINGQRLYKMARKGQDVPPVEKQVNIKEIELLEFESPIIRCRVKCGKGTYIRSLANEIGERIGCGAYLAALSRSEVGNFRLSEALSLDEIRHYRQAESLGRFVRSIEEVLSLPCIRIDERFAAAIISGQSPRAKDVVGISREFAAHQLVGLTDLEGRIMAIGKTDIDSSMIMEQKTGNFFHYVRVLN